MAMVCFFGLVETFYVFVRATQPINYLQHFKKIYTTRKQCKINIEQTTQLEREGKHGKLQNNSEEI